MIGCVCVPTCMRWSLPAILSAFLQVRPLHAANSSSECRRCALVVGEGVSSASLSSSLSWVVCCSPLTAAEREEGREGREIDGV